MMQTVASDFSHYCDCLYFVLNQSYLGVTTFELECYQSQLKIPNAMLCRIISTIVQFDS